MTYPKKALLSYDQSNIYCTLHNMHTLNVLTKEKDLRVSFAST